MSVKKVMAYKSPNVLSWKYMCLQYICKGKGGRWECRMWGNHGENPA